jgi:hypothetical protein
MNLYYVYLKGQNVAKEIKAEQVIDIPSVPALTFKIGEETVASFDKGEVQGWEKAQKA